MNKNVKIFNEIVFFKLDIFEILNKFILLNYVLLVLSLILNWVG